MTIPCSKGAPAVVAPDPPSGSTKEYFGGGGPVSSSMESFAIVVGELLPGTTLKTEYEQLQNDGANRQDDRQRSFHLYIPCHELNCRPHAHVKVD